MKWLLLVGAIALQPGAFAQTLTLDQYLAQVRSQNLQARSLIESIQAFESRSNSEPRALLMPQFYAQIGVMDDQRLTSNPSFSGVETRGQQWQVGFKKQTEYGLGANLYFNSLRTDVSKASPQFLPVPNYNESKVVLELTQSLWRNGFGESTQARMESDEAALKAAQMEAKFNLKELLLGAQNIYWSLVSYNEIVKLQEDNVDRAKKLRDRMGRGEKLRLFDDTDSMQAEAAYQSRELELQTSIDERASLIRQFNTMRGVKDDPVPELQGLPMQVMSEQSLSRAKGKMMREDFEMLRTRAISASASARASRSLIRPQLDLQAAVSGNGRDGLTSTSYDQSFSDKYPMYSVGIVFSTYLDFFLIRDLKRGYRSARHAADVMKDFVDYNEERTWNDLADQRKEVFGRYKRALSVEKIQTELVKRERKRLANGRATTFEALNIEQGLALAQIQRVRSQLAFLQIHNALQTFEVPK
jgi:outer membrane protein TolC